MLPASTVISASDFGLGKHPFGASLAPNLLPQDLQAKGKVAALYDRAVRLTRFSRATLLYSSKSMPASVDQAEGQARAQGQARRILQKLGTNSKIY